MMAPHFFLKRKAVDEQNTLGGRIGLLITVSSQSADLPQPENAPVTPLKSGIETQYIDNTVRAQDDFYQYVNGKWLASTEIPPDKGSYGSFNKLNDDTQDQLRSVIEGLQKSVDAGDPDQQKIADLYSSFMDEATLERLGSKPLNAEFAKIDALKSKTEIASLIAHFNQIGVTAPYTPVVHQDAKDSTKYVFDLSQDGLGMPDRDYYLQNDAKLKQIRAQYGQHVEKMLELAGDKAAAANAKDIVALETAARQSAVDEGREPRSGEDLQQSGVREACRVGSRLRLEGLSRRLRRRQGKTDYLVIRQPSYITGSTNSAADAAVGLEGLLSLAPAQRLRPVPEQAPSSTSTSRSMAPRCAGSNRTSRAGSAALTLIEARSARASASSTWRVFPGRVQGAHGPAGDELAGRLQRRHRHARLDEPGDQAKGAGEARQIHARKSATRRSGAITARSRSSRAILPAT